MHMKLEDVRNILILGAGTMGLRIGLQAAISGYHTVIYDISDRSFSYARKTQQQILDFLVKNNKLTLKRQPMMLIWSVNQFLKTWP
jgi:3-hydroxybutyryl-CoA dehydrogenase